MNVREFLEGGIMIICGIYLISPVFNSFRRIESLSFLEHFPEGTTIHLAWALAPVVLYLFITMFIKKKKKDEIDDI